ncbi:hypothetical protein AB4Z22_19785 [Paenibacillus sp. TAF58]
MKKLHAISSMIALLTIAVFMLSTIVTEIFGSHSSIAILKHLIVLPGLVILIPAMAVAGATGFKIAKGRKGQIIQSKRKRMPVIASIGLIVMVPSAILLSIWASDGLVGTTKFLMVQLIEFLGGAINLTLLGMSMRDGLILTGKLKVKR